MAAPNDPTHLAWLSALREVAHHISKIAEVIAKCADDAERPHPPALTPHAAPSSSRAPAPPAAPAPSSDDDGARAHAAWRGAPAPAPYARALQYAPPPPPPPPDPHAALGAPPRSYSLYYPPDYVVPLRHPAHYPDDDDDDRHARKRRMSAPLHPDFDRGRDLRLLPRSQRASKRVRINWTEEENKVFFDTIGKHATLDESGVLREIVKALGRTRSWVQCKGHFRNLVVVGRIIIRDGPPKKWAVLEESAAKRPGPKITFVRQEPKSDQTKEDEEDGDAEKREGTDGSRSGSSGSGGAGELQTSSKERKIAPEDRQRASDGDEADDLNGRADDPEAEEGSVDQDEAERGSPDLRDVKMPAENGKYSGDEDDDEDEDAPSKGPLSEQKPNDRPTSSRRSGGKNSFSGRHTVPPRKQAAGREEENGRPMSFRRLAKRRSMTYRQGTLQDGRYFSSQK